MHTPAALALTELEDRLSRPSAAEIELFTRLDGDIAVLGATGKMGPSLVSRLCRIVRRSGRARRIYAVSRSITAAPEGAEAIRCDFENADEVFHLPEAENVFYLVGRKFGSTGTPDLTWSANAVAPSFAGWHYKNSRIVLLSSGNVYPLVDGATSRGSTESDPPEPLGEYAQSALARERIFESYSRRYRTRCAFIRLNYAVDLRYGTLVDIARRVWEGVPVPLSVAKVNAIWQGDANRYAILALESASAPPAVWNVTSPEIVDVRETAAWFAQRFGKELRFEGQPSGGCLLNNPASCVERYGAPEVDLATLREWVAQWIESGGPLLDKPTHFEAASDGRY